MMLITGGSGFLGAALVRHFAAHRAVRVLDILNDPGRPEGVGFVRGSIMNAAKVEEACEGVDVVIHCAAAVPLTKDEETMWLVNEAGTRIVRDAAHACKVKHFVHISSSAVYGVPDANPVRINTLPNPQDVYGHSKLCADLLIRPRADRLSMRVAIIRPRTIIGPGRLGLFGKLFKRVSEDRPIPVFNGGKNVYQFVALSDVCAAVERVVNGGWSGEFNVGAAHFCSMRETLEGLVAHAGSRSRIISVPMRPVQALLRMADRVGLSPFAPYHLLMYGKDFWFDVDEMRKRFQGWVPRVKHLEMFAQAYDWYLEALCRGDITDQGNLHVSPHRGGMR